MHYNGLMLSGVLEEFSITSRFLGLKCKYQLFEENKRLRAVFLSNSSTGDCKVSKGAKIRNRYNQVPHLTQDTNGKVTNLQ